MSQSTDKIKEVTKFLIEHDTKECTKTAPIIRMEGWGHTSKLFLCDIDVSKAISAVQYSGKGFDNNHIIIDVDIAEMVKILQGITAEELEKAKEVISPYIKDKF